MTQDFSHLMCITLRSLVRIHLDTCVNDFISTFEVETLTSNAFLMDTKGKAWWTLKTGSGILSFSMYIVKMLWWPNVDNLCRSWWAVSTCACFWGQKGSTLRVVALTARLFPLMRGKAEHAVAHILLVHPGFFPKRNYGAEGTEEKFSAVSSGCNYWMPRWEMWEMASGLTVPTPLMAAEEAEKQNQGGINYHIWTHLSKKPRSFIWHELITQEVKIKSKFLRCVLNLNFSEKKKSVCLVNSFPFLCNSWVVIIGVRSCVLEKIVLQWRLIVKWQLGEDILKKRSYEARNFDTDFTQFVVLWLVLYL